MTGTITPATSIEVVRKDPSLRRADYLKAFSFWLNHPDSRLSRIVFAENSNADLSEFREMARKSGKQVELISVPPIPPPPEMHYGYSELQMIDQALAQSRLRQETSHMIKVTGRLTFPALPRLISRLPNDFEVAVDARARLPFRPSEKGFISVQLILAKHEFYDRYLRRSYDQLQRTGVYPNQVEHLFFEILTPMRSEKGVLLRFPVNCEPVGFPAHKAKRYDSVGGMMKGKTRAVLRVVAPRFWF